MSLTASNINTSPGAEPLTTPTITIDPDTSSVSQFISQQVIQFVDHSMGEIGEIIEAHRSTEQIYATMQVVKQLTLEINEIQDTHNSIPSMVSMIREKLDNIEHVFEEINHPDDGDIREKAYQCLKEFISIASKKLGIPDTKTLDERLSTIKRLVSHYRKAETRK